MGDIHARSASIQNILTFFKRARLMANLVIHIVPDADKAIAEFFRVLAPGGVIGCSVWGESAHSDLFTCACRELSERFRTVPRCLRPRRARQPQDPTSTSAVTTRRCAQGLSALDFSKSFPGTCRVSGRWAPR